jgi:hypothetical protein
MQSSHLVARLSCVAFVATVPFVHLDAQTSTAAFAVQRHGIRLDDLESAAVERGDAIVRVLPTQDQRDVAVFGVVRLAVSRDTYLRRVQDFRNWLYTPTRTGFGLFSDPAVAADVENVAVSRDDAKDLRNCRAGDCTTKLPVSEMQHVQGEVDWAAKDVVARVTALARLRMVQYVGEYRDHGNASMPVYDDRPSVRSSDAFAAVLAQSSYLNQAAPAVASYFRTFPRGRPAGIADVMYWSEDAVARLRPILSITHAVVYTPPELAGTTVVASKQIYANHYFEAALEVMNVSDRDVSGEPAATYLIIERRFRFDNLPKGGILNIRGRAVNGLRDQLRDDLRREKAAADRISTR